MVDKEPVVTTHRALTAFNKIELYDNINLILIQDTVAFMDIVAGSTITKAISAIVPDSTLIIKNTSSFKWLQIPSEKIKVFLHFTQLENIAYYGSGTITSANALHLNSLQIESSKGAGTIELTLNAVTTQIVIRNEDADIILHGKSDACVVYNTPKGTIDLRDFAVADMDINQLSIQDAYVNVTHSLKGEIQYKGNVYYKGNPSFISVKTYNEGRLVEMK